MRPENYLVLQRHFNAALTHYLGHLMEGNCNNLYKFMKVSVEAVTTMKTTPYRQKSKHKNSGNHGIDLLSCKMRRRMVYTRRQGGSEIWRAFDSPSIGTFCAGTAQFLCWCAIPLQRKGVFFIFPSVAGRRRCEDSFRNNKKQREE